MTRITLKLIEKLYFSTENIFIYYTKNQQAKLTTENVRKEDS